MCIRDRDEEPHDDVNFKFCFEKYIKDSYEDELSDTVIRCLDLVGLKQIYLPTLDSIDAVSYTHLDVYKRQAHGKVGRYRVSHFLLIRNVCSPS